MIIVEEGKNKVVELLEMKEGNWSSNWECDYNVMTLVMDINKKIHSNQHPFLSLW